MSFLCLGGNKTASLSATEESSKNVHVDTYHSLWYGVRYGYQTHSHMNGFFMYQFLILFVLLICTNAASAWFIFDMHKKMRRFLGNTGMDIETDLAHDLMRRIARLEAKSEEIDPRLTQLEATSEVSLQKVGFMRFNPFPDTGGDNSFMLVLLNRNNTGVLVSSLFMREGVRLYAKSIEQGKSKHILSEDEKKVLDDTLAKQ